MIPGSHLHHDEICASEAMAKTLHDFVSINPLSHHTLLSSQPILTHTNPNNPSDHPVMTTDAGNPDNPSSPEAMNEGEAEVKGMLLCTQAGDFIIWDSRTIHCNTPALNTDNLGQQDLKDKEKGKSIPGDGSVHVSVEKLENSSELSELSELETIESSESSELQVISEDSNDRDGDRDIIRLVAYVSMLPVSTASEDVLRRRKHALIHHIGTNKS